jgi:hypothetical protein
MPEHDLILEGLAVFCQAHDVVVEKRGRGYSLLSRQSGAPVARLRLTNDPAKVHVLWWDGEQWKAPGPFGTPTMTLERALDYIASERAFWIHVCPPGAIRNGQTPAKSPSGTSRTAALV